jgi:hypothetical protein
MISYALWTFAIGVHVAGALRAIYVGWRAGQ